jgi:hypothetical protein
MQYGSHGVGCVRWDVPPPYGKPSGARGLEAEDDAHVNASPQARGHPHTAPWSRTYGDTALHTPVRAGGVSCRGMPAAYGRY